jgi:hypothetical protein
MEGRRGVRTEAAAGIEGPAARRGGARVLHGVPDPRAAAILQATVGEVTHLTLWSFPEYYKGSLFNLTLKSLEKKRRFR